MISTTPLRSFVVAIAIACTLWLNVLATPPGEESCASSLKSQTCRSSVLLQREQSPAIKLSNAVEDRGIFDTIFGGTDGASAESENPDGSVTTKKAVGGTDGASAESENADGSVTTNKAAPSAVPDGLSTDSAAAKAEQAPAEKADPTATVQEAGAIDMDTLSFETYEKLTTRGDEKKVSEFIMKTAKALGLTEVTKGALSGLGSDQVKQPGTFEDLVLLLLEMRDDSLTSTVNELSGSEAPVSEQGYMAVAQLHSVPEMSKFIERVAEKDGMQVDKAGGIQGVVPWYNGVKAVQSLSKLKEELKGQCSIPNGWAMYAGAAKDGSDTTANSVEETAAEQEGAVLDESTQAISTDGQVVMEEAEGAEIVTENGEVGAETVMEDATASVASVTDGAATVATDDVADEEAYTAKRSKAEKTKAKSVKAKSVKTKAGKTEAKMKAKTKTSKSTKKTSRAEEDEEDYDEQELANEEEVAAKQAAYTAAAGDATAVTAVDGTAAAGQVVVADGTGQQVTYVTDGAAGAAGQVAYTDGTGTYVTDSSGQVAYPADGTYVTTDGAGQVAYATDGTVAGGAGQAVVADAPMVVNDGASAGGVYAQAADGSTVMVADNTATVGTYAQAPAANQVAYGAPVVDGTAEVGMSEASPQLYEEIENGVTFKAKLGAAQTGAAPGGLALATGQPVQLGKHKADMRHIDGNSAPSKRVRPVR